ncbi:hypothetical protein N473_20805 [Pseudoalteromonas luteoviolacea CPMOR-1]|uniref:2Fe-2S ferredoxin-type domain-containing protein n=1 Tax=Pseudoalteromonas luteoviolacea CPMOR-1 TaxID=1365248 RepID=A0A167K1R5_9GAMM|nr:class I ribonucleotide reductase maintenance protein YfaE [Pseudoalteromonas luteoviolacea]KZN61986.1 hypothetical protein N473_20805 [Pseudoalteromonas luteoviolacea CPMOR-1]
MEEKPELKISIEDHDEPLKFAAQSPSLLCTLEQNNIEIPYQCREGYCGACRAKLIDGQVAYNQEPLAFVRDGEVLLCCSKPITDVVIKLT